MAKPIPEGYHSVTPYLIIKGATEAIDFYKKAFGASELFRMLAAGGKEQRPVKDQFYGDRSGTLEDPFGHVWHVATHKEDVSPEEMERRVKSYTAASGGGQ